MSSVKSAENKSSSKKTDSRCKTKRDEAGSSTSKTSPRDPKNPRTTASDPIEVDIDQDLDDHAIRKKGETSDHNELLDLLDDSRTDAMDPVRMVWFVPPRRRRPAPT
ncbi:unnamed protein product, partial [Aphanomyces euteiches]